MGDRITEGSDTSARQDPLVGRRLASYEVLARVARGGMGVVYRARHVYIDKIVALKVLDPALSKREDLIERFRTEAQSLARVEHDNVVKVIDILEDSGPDRDTPIYFIVMDFAEGVNLRNLVKDQGPLKGDQLLSIARQTAEALYAAHREGILHRDIKPENLIMNSRGRCKLADFGLAGDLRLISQGHEGPLNFGTPAYSSPEVLRRMVPDKRSDIFSFGATLFFLATGEPPFGQTGATQIMLRQKQGAELLEARRPDLPPKFCRIVMDCLQYHPKNRPADFIEVLDRLPRRMVTRSVPGTPTAPTDTTQLDSGTHESPDTGAWNPLLIALSVMGVLTILAVLVIWIGPLLTGGKSQPLNNTVSDNGDSPRGPFPPVNVNRPPEDDPPTDPEPAFRPEDEAFNDAELTSRAALGNTDYLAAWEAWNRFIERYPDSEHRAAARDRQADVKRRVAELRVQEYDKAKQASDEALREKRTAEALAAIERFPAELLVPLGPGDDVDVQRKLDTQRQVAVAAEASDLARLLENAEALRSDWLEDRANSSADEFRRMRSAGNLLKERDMLEDFLPGRTAESQEKVEKRLGGLRKLIEGVHQSALEISDDWRRFHDEALGAWAQRALAVIAGQPKSLEKRDFKGPLSEIEDIQSELKALQSTAAGEAKHPELAKRIRDSDYVTDLVKEYHEDLLLANRLFIALENNLRTLRRGNDVREFMVHSSIDADGNRSGRLERYSGRVVSVGRDDFTVSVDGERVTIEFDMLNAATIRRVVAGGDSFDEQLTLVAWLVAIGRDGDADIEFSRLERMARAPRDVISRGRDIVREKTLGPEAIRRLKFIAMRCGLRPWEEIHEPESLLHRLAVAQQALERESGTPDAARNYLSVAGDADPQWISLAAFARAARATETSETLLKSWVNLLEPLNPTAYVTLATALHEAGEHSEARTWAGRALLLDGSNEAAWRVWLR